MNEVMFLAATIVGGIFGLIGLQLMQQNWYKREDLKYKYDVKRAKARSKNIPVKATSTPTSPMDWIETIKKLDPDVVHGFIDSVSGSRSYSDEGEEEEGGIEGTIMNIAKNNPELVQNFLKGLNDAKGGQQEQQIVR